VIKPETVTIVRDRTDILAVIGEAVPSLKRRGRSWVGLCPFHKEKTPSFHVNPERGFFHCFGCKEHGSAIDFLMKFEGATFPEAVRSLAERIGVTVEETERVDRTEADRQKKQKEDLFTVNGLAAMFFEEQLRSHEHRQYAIDELARRGLKPTDDVIQEFRIGYAPPGWDGLATFLRAQGISPVVGEGAGLLVPRSSGTGHYDRFRHRLMFAVIDVQGRVIAFSGRALAPTPEMEAEQRQRGGEGGAPAKYINSPESPVYTKGQHLFGLYQARHEIRTKEHAVLVEGNFDVVSLHARGLTNVVAPLGTAFTVDQAKLLKRFAPNVIFCFDGDAAGRKATRLSRDPAREAGLIAKVAVLPEGSDPDDLARTRGPQVLEGILGQARGMLEYLIDTSLDESFSQADAFERARRVEEVSKLLASEDDPLVRSMAKAYADRLAGRLDMQRSPDAFRALERAVKQALADARARQPGPGPEGDPKSARIKHRPPGAAERREIILALVEQPALLEDPEVQEALALLEGNSVLVVRALRDSLVDAPPDPPESVGGSGPGGADAAQSAPSRRKSLDFSRFLSQIPEPIRPFASERLAAPRFSSVSEAKEHLLDNGKKLKRLVLSQESAELAKEQHRAAGDWETEQQLAREAEERIRRKHGLPVSPSAAALADDAGTDDTR
jgi:DNA primase